MRKRAGVLIAVLIILLSVTVIKPLMSAPAASTPEFYVRLAARPYDVPTAYVVDNATGQATLLPAHREDNLSLEVLVKNQPCALSLSGTTYRLYYDVHIKGPSDQNWTEQYQYTQSSPGNLPIQSSTEYTVLSFPQVYPDGAQVDFQVRALIGTDQLVTSQDGQHQEWRTVMNITSAWSNTQTIIIDTSHPTVIPYASS